MAVTGASAYGQGAGGFALDASGFALDECRYASGARRPVQAAFVADAIEYGGVHGAHATDKGANDFEPNANKTAQGGHHFASKYIKTG